MIVVLRVNKSTAIGRHDIHVQLFITFMSICLKKKLKAIYLKGAEYFNLECVEGFNANVNNGEDIYINITYHK